MATILRSLREIRDWLIQAVCRAAGAHWIPVCVILEGHVPMVVGNPNHLSTLKPLQFRLDLGADPPGSRLEAESVREASTAVKLFPVITY